MTNALLALTLLSIPTFLVGFVFLFFKRKRRISWKLMLGSVIVFFVSVIIFGISHDRDARNLGFLDAQDLKRAREVGIANAEAWGSLRPQYEKLLLDKAQNIELLRQQRETELAAQKAEAERLAAAQKDAAEKERLRAAEEKARTEQAARERAAAAKEEENRKCRSELSCWAEKFSISAGISCRDPVERLAKNNFEWTDGWLEPKFSHFRWRDRDRGTVTYLGDRIKFQNSFGAWIIHVYECDYDPEAKRVLAVRARPGRI